MSAFDSLTGYQKLILKSTADEFYGNGIEFHPSYSGRGMFGETTYGFSGNLKDLAVFLQILGYRLCEEGEEVIRNWSVDQLGLDMIFYIH